MKRIYQLVMMATALCLLPLVSWGQTQITAATFEDVAAASATEMVKSGGFTVEGNDEFAVVEGGLPATMTVGKHLDFSEVTATISFGYEGLLEGVGFFYKSLGGDLVVSVENGNPTEITIPQTEGWEYVDLGAFGLGASKQSLSPLYVYSNNYYRFLLTGIGLPHAKAPELQLTIEKASDGSLQAKITGGAVNNRTIEWKEKGQTASLGSEATLASPVDGKTYVCTVTSLGKSVSVEYPKAAVAATPGTYKTLTAANATVTVKKGADVIVLEGTVEKDATITIEVTPAQGYKLAATDAVVVTGLTKAAGTNEYTVNGGDFTITVNVVKAVPTLTAITGGDNGAGLYEYGKPFQLVKKGGELTPNKYYLIYPGKGKILTDGSSIAGVGVKPMADYKAVQILASATDVTVTYTEADAKQVNVTSIAASEPKVAVKLIDLATNQDITLPADLYVGQAVRVDVPANYKFQNQDLNRLGFTPLPGDKGDYLLSANFKGGAISIPVTREYSFLLKGDVADIKVQDAANARKTYAFDGSITLKLNTLVRLILPAGKMIDPVASTIDAKLFEPAGENLYRVKGDVDATIKLKDIPKAKVTNVTVTPSNLGDKYRISAFPLGAPKIDVEVGTTEFLPGVEFYIVPPRGYMVDFAKTTATGATLKGKGPRFTLDKGATEVTFSIVFVEKTKYHIVFTSDKTGWKVKNSAGEVIAPTGDGMLYEGEPFTVEAPAGYMVAPPENAKFAQYPDGYRIAAPENDMEINLPFAEIATISKLSITGMGSIYHGQYPLQLPLQDYKTTVGGQFTVWITARDAVVDLENSVLEGAEFDPTTSLITITKTTARVEVKVIDAPNMTLIEDNVTANITGWKIEKLIGSPKEVPMTYPISLLSNFEYTITAPSGYRLDWENSTFTDLTVNKSAQFFRSMRYKYKPALDLKFIATAMVTVTTTPADVKAVVFKNADGSAVIDITKPVDINSTLLVVAPAGKALDFNASTITGGEKLTDGKFKITEANATLNLAFTEASTAAVTAINVVAPTQLQAPYAVKDYLQRTLAAGSTVPLGTTVVIEPPKNYFVKDLKGSGFELLKTDVFNVFTVTGDLTLNITFEAYPPVQIEAVDAKGETGYKLLLVSNDEELQLKHDYDKYTEFYIIPPDKKALVPSEILQKNKDLNAGNNGTYIITETIPNLELVWDFPSGQWALLKRLKTNLNQPVTLKRFRAKVAPEPLRVGEALIAGDGISFTVPLGYEIDWDKSDFGILKLSTIEARKNAHIYDVPADVAEGANIEINLVLKKVNFALSQLIVNNDTWGKVEVYFNGQIMSEGGELEGGKNIEVVVEPLDPTKYEFGEFDKAQTKGLKYISRDMNRYTFTVIGEVVLAVNFREIDNTKLLYKTVTVDSNLGTLVLRMAGSGELVQPGERLAQGTKVRVLAQANDRAHYIVDQESLKVTGLVPVPDSQTNEYTVAEDATQVITLAVNFKKREPIAVELQKTGDGDVVVKIEKIEEDGTKKEVQLGEKVFYPNDKVVFSVEAAKGSRFVGKPAAPTYAGAGFPYNATEKPDHFVVHFDVPAIYILCNVEKIDNSDSKGTAVESALLASTVAFPNPVVDILTVRGVQAARAYALFSTAGQQLMSGVVTGQELQLNLANLRSGVYFLRLLDQEGNTRTLRVVRL